MITRSETIDGLVLLLCISVFFLQNLEYEMRIAHELRFKRQGFYFYNVERSERAKVLLGRSGGLTESHFYPSIFQGLRFAPHITAVADSFVADRFGNEPFLAVHWRLRRR